MAGSPEVLRSRKIAGPIAAAVGLGLLFFLFPPFRIVPIKAPGDRSVGPSGVGAFDPAAAAAQVWLTDLPAAAVRAVDLAVLAPALRADPAQARATHGRASGLGVAYYFVRGHGRIVARDRNHVHVEIAGPAGPTLVALRTGPVFGNTVRDGCGLFDVNSFPGLAEFNALSAALNALVERDVQPALRDRAVVGAEIDFAGCAEAPEGLPAPGEPLLSLIPVQAGIR
jgi:predicted lipoprotein